MASANANAGNAKAATNGASSANGGTTTPADGTPAIAAPGVTAAAQYAVAAGFGRGTDPSSSSDDDSSAPTVAGAGGQDPAALGAAALAAMSTAAPPLSPVSTASAQATLALADVTAMDKHAHAEAGGASLSDTSGGAAGAAQLTAGPGTGTDATATPSLKVSSDVGTPEFAQEVTDHLSWMVGNGLNGAKLEVNPAQLGPIEVRIAVQGDQAQVSLTAHSAATRDALEASSPKLREMLGAQGFAHVSVDISQRSFQDRSPAAQSYDWQPPSERSASSAAPISASASTPRISSGVLDAYA
jgi:flagellar hook-length control protein FliK